MTTLRHFLCISLLAAAIILLNACTSDRPDDVLSPDKMEEVLYDYHLAKAINTPEGIPSSPEESKRIAESYYVQSALAKHGLTEADFDRSLRWYTRHSEILYKIYRNLDKRSGEKSGTTAPSHPAPGSAPSGDTLNVWRGDAAVLLSSSAVNSYSFSQEADTTIRKGDRIVFKCNALWAYREGAKAAVVQLAVHFANDSVASTTHYFYSNGPQEVILAIGDEPVKSITGFIYQVAEWSERPKLLSLTGLTLLRIRGAGGARDERLLPQKLDTDSLKRPMLPEHRLRDSLFNEENADKRRSHFQPIDISTSKQKADGTR